MPHNLCQWLAYLVTLIAGATVAVAVQSVVMRVFLKPQTLIDKVIEENPSASEFRNSRHIGTQLQGWVGTIEIFLYASSVVFGHPEFIVAWFATKYVSSYHTWSKDPVGRTFYNRSLFGSGLNILLGFITGECALAAISHFGAR
jgi:hypothetical protein